MLQEEIDLAVANITGESLVEIERLGFTLADPAEVEYDPDPLVRWPLVIDWDRYHTQIVDRATGDDEIRLV